MPIITFNPTDFIYNAGELEIDASLLKILLQSDNVDFTENFTSDIGFTYDNTKSEFVGGRNQQKDTRDGALFGANFAVNQNATWSIGSSTGTLYGGASITGETLDLSGGVISYAKYSSTNNLGISQGAIKFKITPKYSGSPPAYYWFFCDVNLVGIANEFSLFQTNSGNICLSARDYTGALVINTFSFGNWGQTADQTYEFALNFYIDPGGSEIRFFIDGEQKGPTITTAYTRDDHERLFFGCEWSESTNADFLIDDIVLFDTVQHTTNYTPGYTVNNTIYIENNVIMPEMEHIGDGSILAFNSFSTTEGGTPRYTLQIGRSGDYLYWNGAVWAVSNGTYAQANDATTFNANVGTLPVSGEKYGQFQIHYTNTNTQSYVDTLNANMLVNIGYLTTNPSGVSDSFRTDGINSVTAVEYKTGSDELKYVFLKDGTQYWHNGVDWVVSNSTYAESNTLTEVQTYITDFFDPTEGGKDVKVEAFFHSDDGTTTPALESITIDYSFAGDFPTVSKVVIYGYLRDLFGPVEDETIEIRPAWTISDTVILKGDYKEVTSLTAGYFEVNCYIEDVPPDFLIWKIGTKLYKTDFVNQSYVKVGELTILEESKR